MKSVLTGVIGLLVGGFVGFQLRPAVFLLGQLPFGTVITRGSNLSGLDMLLVSAAQTSFNYMVAGAVLGAVCGLVAGALIPRGPSQRPA
jgi:hypothetical protein